MLYYDFLWSRLRVTYFTILAKIFSILLPSPMRSFDSSEDAMWSMESFRRASIREASRNNLCPIHRDVTLIAGAPLACIYQRFNRQYVFPIFIAGAASASASHLYFVACLMFIGLYACIFGRCRMKWLITAGDKRWNSSCYTNTARHQSRNHQKEPFCMMTWKST